MCGELYVVMDDGKTFNIGTEEYYEYYPELQFYEGEEENFAILNFANSVTGSDGYVFSGDQANGMIWFAEVPMGMKYSGLPGTSRYITTKNRKNTPDRLELKKYNPILKKMTIHKEIK